ncbi:hypothetical protein HDK77DRAFT_38379 [Phyllosticta capitalensis]
MAEMHKRALRGMIVLPALVLGATLTSAPSPTITGSKPDASITVDPSEYTWAGSDSSAVSEVLKCQSSWDGYYKRSYSYSDGEPSYSTSMFSTWAFAGNYTGEISTLCDGVPRGSGAASTLAPSSFVITEYPFPEPTPTCTYDYAGCSRLIVSQRDPAATATQFPDCGFDPANCIGIVQGETNCRLDAADVKVMYWPQSKDASELCTPSPLPTKPVAVPIRTVVSGTNTFSSPSIYLSFSYLTALPCFGSWDDVVIAVPPESISSVDYDHVSGGRHTKSINWLDFNYPVPASAYRGQTSCAYGDREDGCSTVYDGDYNPQLALPTNPALFTNLNPGFANCSALSWRVAVQDPPIALQTVNGGLLPGNSVAATATDPASPASRTAGATATSTAGLGGAIMTGLGASGTHAASASVSAKNAGVNDNGAVGIHQGSGILGAVAFALCALGIF